MNYTINVFVASTPEAEQLVAFCEPRGIFLHQSREFAVVVKELPEIFSKLKSIGYSDAQENKWMLASISDEGLALLINNIDPNATMPQSTIFLPMSNIICIHSITERVLAEIKTNKMLVSR